LRTINGGSWIVFVFGVDSPIAPLLLGYQKNAETVFVFAELKSRLKMPHLLVFSVIIITNSLSTLFLPSLTTDFFEISFKILNVFIGL
jgi:hypothetical protein